MVARVMVADETWQAAKDRKDKAFAGLSVGAKNGLWNSNIESKEQAANLTDAQLLRIPNFGRKALAEVRAWVAGCTPEHLETATKRGMLEQRIVRARGEVQRAQEKLRWLEATAAAFDGATDTDAYKDVEEYR